MYLKHEHCADFRENQLVTISLEFHCLYFIGALQCRAGHALVHTAPLAKFKRNIIDSIANPLNSRQCARLQLGFESADFGPDLESSRSEPKPRLPRTEPKPVMYLIARLSGSFGLVRFGPGLLAEPIRYETQTGIFRSKNQWTEPDQKRFESDPNRSEPYLQPAAPSSL
jgi:hypothetical protein